MNQKIALFEDKEIRKIYKNNNWYYSIHDILKYLTNTSNPNEYIKKLRQKDKELDNIWDNICIDINMLSKDNKIRKVLSSNTLGILRIIESISSKDTEPIKIWLAKLGVDRIEEISNPELAMDRMKNLYELKGYSKGWIEQREREITIRHTLKEEWEKRGLKESKEQLILNNEIYQSNFNIDINEYKNIKGIKDDTYLKDSMTNLELALSILGETLLVELHNKNNSQGLNEIKKDITKAGKIINNTSKEISKELEKDIISNENYLNLTNK